MQKNIGEVRWCGFRVMQADRQTNGHIYHKLRTPPGGGNDNKNENSGKEEIRC